MTKKMSFAAIAAIVCLICFQTGCDNDSSAQQTQSEFNMDFTGSFITQTVNSELSTPTPTVMEDRQVLEPWKAQVILEKRQSRMYLSFFWMNPLTVPKTTLILDSFWENSSFALKIPGIY